MRNMHPGVCYRCGQWCAVGDGHFERKPGGWRVQHVSCAIAHRGTDVGKDGATEQREAIRIARLKRESTMTGKKGQRARHRLRQEGILA